jgi:hypothetical protein
MHELMSQGNISLSFEPDLVSRVATILRGIVIYRRAETDALERCAELLDRVRGNQ